MGNKAEYERNKATYLVNDRKRRLAKYGMTVEDYDTLLEAQGGHCAICHKEQNQKSGQPMRLAVDHNHKTGVVRGLLCYYCNRYVVGRRLDNDFYAQRLAQYILKPPAPEFLGLRTTPPKRKKKRRKR